MRGSPLFHIVLHEPEIPNNTGNIGRTCVATGCALHLIHPLGFEVSEKACRRAGLDYWPRLDVHEHQSWPAFTQSSALNHQSSRIWLFSTKPGASVFSTTFHLGDCLVFGKETAGLPDEILAQHPRLFLPMVPGERSLNLATAVCTVIYEGVRQLLASGELSLDASGRLIERPSSR